MPRAYIRLDPGLFERKLAQGYPPGALAAFVACLCLAESQPERGSFRDVKVLSVLLTRPFARWLPYLIERKDLVSRHGRLYVEGWSEWQEGDVTVAERVARLRARRAQNGAEVVQMVTGMLTPPVTVGVTGPVTPERRARARPAEAVSEAVSGEPYPNGSPKRPLSPEEERATLMELVATQQALLDNPETHQAARTAAEKGIAKAQARLEQLPATDEDDVDFSEPDSDSGDAIAGGSE